MIKAVIFDWGDTLMRDFPEKQGPMADWDVIEVIDGVPETLEALKKDYTLCAATNAGFSDTVLMQKALKRGKIEHFFDFFFSSKDIGYKKPDPRFFLHICLQLNLMPYECLAVGNDYEKDIVAAKTAGLKTLWFNEKRITKSANSTEVIFSIKELINHKIFEV